MKFTQEFKKKSKSSKLRMELALKLDVSYFTINRRLDNPKNEEFEKSKYLKILSEHFDIPENEIFETD